MYTEVIHVILNKIDLPLIFKKGDNCVLVKNNTCILWTVWTERFFLMIDLEMKMTNAKNELHKFHVH